MHLLPPNSTASERALSRTTARILDIPTAPVRQLWNPNECPAEMLPWLSWSLSVEPWESAWDERTKRNAIANAIRDHLKKGTVAAVRRALSSLGYEVQIDERTGEAYTFKLLVDAEGKGYGKNEYDTAEAAAIAAKNARSHLSGVNAIITKSSTLHFSSAAIDGISSQTEASFTRLINHASTIHILAAHAALETTVIQPGFPNTHFTFSTQIRAAHFVTMDTEA